MVSSTRTFPTIRKLYGNLPGHAGRDAGAFPGRRDLEPPRRRHVHLGDPARTSTRGVAEKAIAENVAFVPGAPFFANDPQRTLCACRSSPCHPKGFSKVSLYWARCSSGKAGPAEALTLGWNLPHKAPAGSTLRSWSEAPDADARTIRPPGSCAAQRVSTTRRSAHNCWSTGDSSFRRFGNALVAPLQHHQSKTTPQL